MKFPINPRSNFSNTDKLLYNILLELEKLNNSKPKEEAKENIKIEKEIPKSQTANFKCKVCGKEYENKGNLLMCYKKHKEAGKK